ncbi:ATP-binding protein [Alcaligenes faecalis]|uniref:ATP-binding protein n=2 Tax=Alcaligenes faecalis TaxID=511 RepID=UPI0021505513|nr:ATP-binding protein [Alcaligenes faecalis]MCR4144733.1 putative DNA binding domain-containing protein [Alcaligenes faecalis]
MKLLFDHTSWTPRSRNIRIVFERSRTRTQDNMYPIYEIDDTQAANIMATQENYLNDVKAKEIKPAKLSDTISAFANAAGGDVYIGISEDKTTNTRNWLGFNDPEHANDFFHTLFQAHPFGNHVKFEFLRNKSHPGLVLHITVKKVKEIVKSSSGEIFVRVNAGKQKIDTPEKIKRLELDKGIITFENEWVEVSLPRIENSLSILNFLINVIPTGEPLTYLNNQELIKEGHARVCGVLLFCDEPAVFLPKRSSIKIARYKTKDDDIGREFLDGNPVTVEGDAYNLVYNAVSETKKIIEGIKRLGEEGLESVEYPEEALHEVITNAVLHRDYSIVADVQIRVFDNRIEVESPGKLPGHVTTANILNTQSARNPALVRLINKFPNPPNKDLGEGLDTAFRVMETLRLKPPIIAEKDASVLVIIRHEALGSPEELVMQYMETHTEITNSLAREITGIKSENSMKNVFIRLKSRNMLEPIPERKGSASAWRKPINLGQSNTNSDE